MVGTVAEKGCGMELAFFIFVGVHNALAAALTAIYVRNERKRVFVWRRLTGWGRARRYGIAFLLANFALVLALAVVIFSIVLPPTPSGFVSRVQELVRRTDARFIPS